MNDENLNAKVLLSIAPRRWYGHDAVYVSVEVLMYNKRYSRPYRWEAAGYNSNWGDLNLGRHQWSDFAGADAGTALTVRFLKILKEYRPSLTTGALLDLDVQEVVAEFDAEDGEWPPVDWPEAARRGMNALEVAFARTRPIPPAYREHGVSDSLMRAMLGTLDGASTDGETQSLYEEVVALADDLFETGEYTCHLFRSKAVWPEHDWAMLRADHNGTIELVFGSNKAALLAMLPEA